MPAPKTTSVHQSNALSNIDAEIATLMEAEILALRSSISSGPQDAAVWCGTADGYAFAARRLRSLRGRLFTSPKGR